jgi:hypothetical protein
LHSSSATHSIISDGGVANCPLNGVFPHLCNSLASAYPALFGAGQPWSADTPALQFSAEHLAALMVTMASFELTFPAKIADEQQWHSGFRSSALHGTAGVWYSGLSHVGLCCTHQWTLPGA